MADDKIALSIEIEADRAQMSLGELEAGFEELQTKLKATNRGTEEGRKEFKKLASQMAQTSKEIKNIELSFEGLDREQVASEIGSVAGAVGDLSTSLFILSGENETLEKTAQNIETAMRVSMGLKASIEGLASARKLYNNLLRQANEDEKEGIALTVLKTAKEKAAAAGTLILNGVNKLLNTTMKMNPIGLVVTALTLVVAGIVYFKDAIWGLIKTALEPFQFIIDILIDGLQAMGIMASDEAIAQEKAAEKKIKSYQKQAKELEKLREAHERLSKKVLGDLEYELELLKAKGEDTADAEWNIINQKKKNALEAKKIAIDEYKNSQKLLDLRKAQNKEITDEDIKAHNELVKNLKAAGAAYTEAEREQTIFFANRKRERKEQRDKDAAEDKAAAEKASAEAKKRWEAGAADRAMARSKEQQAKKDALMEDIEIADKDLTLQTERLDKNTITIEGLKTNEEILNDAKNFWHNKDLERIAEENAARREAAQDCHELSLNYFKCNLRCF